MKRISLKAIAAFVCIASHTNVWSSNGIASGIGVTLDTPVKAETSVYICAYNDKDFLIARKNTKGCFFDGKILKNPKKIDNNPGQDVFPGGHLEVDSTLINVARAEFRGELGLSLDTLCHESNMTACQFKDGGKSYYAVFVNTEYKISKLNVIVDNLNEGFKKDDHIRLSVRKQYVPEEEYEDGSFVCQDKRVHIMDDELKSISLCAKSDILSKFRTNENSKLDQSWFSNIANHALKLMNDELMKKGSMKKKSMKK